jgi:DHA1 family bicyclomycin/chloramphenicol resistance-like MFS transporter
MRRPALTSGWVTAIIAASIAVTPMSVDMPLPALPEITRAFATSSSNTQLIISLFLIGFAAGQLVYGPVSDRFGRRPVMLGALALFLAASAICIAAGSIEVLLVGRFLQGAGAAGGMVLARACVRDIHGPNMARPMSIVVTFTGLAPILAPSVGGAILAVAGWRDIFILLGVAATGMFVVIWLFLDETNPHRNPAATRPGPMLRTFGRLMASRIFVGFNLMIACMYGAMFTFISAFPFVLHDALGLAPSTIGFAFGGLMVGLIIGAMLSTRLSARRGVLTVLALGFTVLLTAGTALAALAAAGVATLAAVVGPLGLFMLGIGLTSPSAFAGALAPFPRTAGSASSLMGLFQWLGGAAMGALVVALHDGTARPMAFQILALLVVSVLLLVLVVRPAMAREAAEREAAMAPDGVVPDAVGPDAAARDRAVEHSR